MNPTITDKMKGRRLDRRQILKGAGVLSAGGIVTALIPTTALAAADDEEGQTGYQFLDTSDGKGGLTGKSIFMNGVGKFGSGVTGGGNYVITDTATFSKVFDFGSWRAKKFVSFTNVGKVAAGFLGGTLTMDVILQSANGGETEATITVNCDGGAVLTPATGGGGNGSGDVVTLVIKNGTFAGTFEQKPNQLFNVTIFIAPSD